MTEDRTDPSPVCTNVPVEADSTRNLLTVEEAAQRLSLGRTTMYALIKAGEIPSVRIGRLRRVPVEVLAAYTARLLAKQHVA